MKIIDHHPEEGNLWEDPNLRSLLEHSDNLLSEDYRFESPFRDSMGPTSEVDPYDFDLNVDKIGLKDDFDLSKNLTDFVGTIRKEDTGKCESGSKKSIWTVVGALLLCALSPLILFSIMWWGGNSYKNKKVKITYVKPQQEDSAGVLKNSSTTSYNAHSSISNKKGDFYQEGHFSFDQQSLLQSGNRNPEDREHHEYSTKVLTYDWLIILYGVILTLVFSATVIVIVIYLRKREDKEREDYKLFYEHQNKMINEYANYLYSIKRVRTQQCETLLSLKHQHALQRLDFQQREMDMRQKEQDNAWKHKENHLNAVKEHLSNLHFEANPDKKPDTKEEKQSTNQQSTNQQSANQQSANQQSTDQQTTININR